MSEVGFSFSYNILESLTAENWARTSYNGASFMFDQLYADPALKEGFMTSKIKDYLSDKEGPLESPKFVEFALEVEDRTHSNWQPKEASTDDLVVKLVDLLSEDLQKMINQIPSSRLFFSKLKSARSRFKLFTERIYPTLATLIEHDLVNQALNEAGLPPMDLKPRLSTTR